MARRARGSRPPASRSLVSRRLASLRLAPPPRHPPPPPPPAPPPRGRSSRDGSLRDGSLRDGSTPHGSTPRGSPHHLDRLRLVHPEHERLPRDRMARLDRLAPAAEGESLGDHDVLGAATPDRDAPAVPDRA